MNPFSGFTPTETFNGFKVYLSPDTPKRVLSKDVPVSDEMRTRVDAWMLGFFGTTNMLADGACIFSEVYGTVMMNPRTYQQFKLQMGAMYGH